MLVTQRASNRMIAGIACLFIAEPTRQLPKPLGDSGSIGVGRLLMASESAAPVKQVEERYLLYLLKIMWMDHKLPQRHRAGHPGPRRARAAEPGSRHHDDAGAVVTRSAGGGPRRSGQRNLNRDAIDRRHTTPQRPPQVDSQRPSAGRSRASGPWPAELTCTPPGSESAGNGHDCCELCF